MGVWTFMGSSGEGNDDLELLQTIPLREGVVGADETCALQLHDRMITPRHARVLHQAGHWYLGGIAAAAPTLVNGVATLPGQAVQLQPGDLVQMGKARFRFGGEPPPRTPIDPTDESALLIWADRQAEAGNPMGLRILERQLPHESWFPEPLREAFKEGQLQAEWTRGVLTAALLRESSSSELESLLCSELAAGLERLTVLVATSAEHGEAEAARGVLQAVALARPPRLRELRFGWLHGAPGLSGLARDWHAVASRVPLEGAAEASFQRAGRPRYTMLTQSPGWPELGTTQVVAPMDQFEPADHWRQYRLRGAAFACTASGAIQMIGEDMVVNGLAVVRGRTPVLVHGDLVHGRGFAFRFEED